MLCSDKKYNNNYDENRVFGNLIANGSSLLTIQELSSWLKIKTKTIYNLVHREQIPYIKVGRLLRFEIEAINKWLTSHRRSYVD